MHVDIASHPIQQDGTLRNIRGNFIKSAISGIAQSMDVYGGMGVAVHF